MSRLLSEQSWSAIIATDAEPGAFVAADLEQGGCEVTAHIAVVKGKAAAGSVVQLQGAAVRGDRGLVIQNGVLTNAHRSNVLLALRSSAGRNIDQLFGDRAGLVRALLIADSRQIDTGLRDNFADSGLVHMLSISGLHVGIIAAATVLLLRAVRLSIAPAMTCSTLITAVYVLIIGAPAPAVRAAAMLCVFAASRLMQRPTSPWAALALGALVPLLDPRAVSSLGYQLSVAGMIGLISAGVLIKRASISTAGIRGAITTSLVATVVASMVTAPIIAWHFGRISLIAPLANLAAAPLMLLLQPLLFLALLLAPLFAVASFAADAAQPLLFLFEEVARIAAAPDWAAVDVAPSLLSVLVSGAGALALILAINGDRPARFIVVAAASATLVILSPLLPGIPGGGRLEIHLIDVGQGDAIAVRLPDRRWILFDAGRSWRGGDAGRRVVIPYLRRRGGELFAFVLSHPHSDHVGGAGSVIRWLTPRVFWDAAYVAANEDYLSALRITSSSRTTWRRVHPGETVPLGGVVMQFLAPDSVWASTLDDPNEASTVAVLRYGNVTLMLTGDAEKAEEEWLVAKYGVRLRSTILKVAHHGSKTSSTPIFLDAVKPKVALISVGAGNRYGHPSPDVVAELLARGTTVLRTDLHGHVVLSTDGKDLVVEARGERWPLQ